VTDRFADIIATLGGTGMGAARDGADVLAGESRRGRVAYRLGLPRTACPPHRIDGWRAAWRGGWDAAHEAEVVRRARKIQEGQLPRVLAAAESYVRADRAAARRTAEGDR